MSHLHFQFRTGVVYRLFTRSAIEDYIRERRTRMQSSLTEMSNDEVRAVDAEQFASDLAERFEIRPPILRDPIEFDPPERNVRGFYEIKLFIRYEGDGRLFECRGRNSPIIPYDCQVTGTHVVCYLTHAGLHEIPRREVESVLNQIKSGLLGLQIYIYDFNGRIKGEIINTIRWRQKEIADREAFVGGFKGMGFSLRRRDDGTDKIIVPLEQKMIKLAPPAPATTKERAAELVLADYDQILNVIQSMVRVYERSPSVFKKMGEEHLRTILLVGLNGLFQGNATGETFNGDGKTDILIRYEDKNLFLAECLIWDGEEHFRKKLEEQLFKYATWHDTKLAAIVFNRKKDFSAVVDKMKAVVSSLENRISDLPCPIATGCRTRHRRDDDSQKHFVLTCMAFQVPS